MSGSNRREEQAEAVANQFKRVDWANDRAFYPFRAKILYHAILSDRSHEYVTRCHKAAQEESDRFLENATVVIPFLMKRGLSEEIHPT